MEKSVVSTEHAPKAIGPYSQAIKSGDFVYCSGQVGLDPASGALVSGGVEPEARRALENIRAVLAAAALDFSHVVKTTIFLVDMNDFQKVNEIYGSYFTGAPPARSTVAVAALPRAARVEIEVIARG